MKKLSCKESIIYVFDKANKPALTIDSGDMLEVESYDCFENQIDENNSFEGVDWNRINPATGPVYVNGAQPGDVLKVVIERIEVADYGVMVTGAGIGVMGDRLTGMTQKLVRIENEQVIFDDKLRLPLNKMIGVIGVAPAGDAVPTGTPGAHGGNMDTKLIAEGSTLYLPVMVEGALLALGDLHAAMGDGEVSGAGVEMAGKVTIKVNVLKKGALPYAIKQPAIETDEAMVFIASEKTLDEAVKQSAVYAVEYVSKVTGLSLEEVTILMSAAGNAHISQVVDPLMTARFSVPKFVLKVYGVEQFL